ncbi:MAG: transglutaminase-like cysteine peptidase [Brevundimonas sp.]|jgi:predicted transglutaminase-like cysteine proteinase|nr:transglutaminase-like cysteine peptidase [Brevundimonas sp.]MCA3719339.1 transglutaminase-like cysteine peptidase [Brevundimonas sp.]
MVCKKRPANRVAIALAAFVGLSATTTVAFAEPRGDNAPTMPLGAAAPAPDGFIALCRRAPDQCPASGPIPDLEQLAAEANRRRWTALFGLSPRAATAPAAAPDELAPLLSGAPITSLVPRFLRLTPGLAKATAVLPSTAAFAAEDAARPAVEAAGDPLRVEAVAATDFTATAAAGEAEPAATEITVAEAVPDTTATYTLDRQGWRTVNHINRRLNREIRHVDDLDLHGEQDRWTLPVGSRGDCEDFVLAKRAALLDAGVPAEALSIAIVETRWGETHAVLLLASDRGEFVLDSLSPWVSRWDRVDYRWRERQARGGAFDWVNVAL